MTLALQGQVTLSAGVQSRSGAMWHLNAERVCQCMAGHREGREEVS